MAQEIAPEAIPKEGGEDLVQQMRNARNSPVVHKTTLATFRGQNPECLVFVCEGVEDKKVYFHWLRHLDPDLDYEFQVCNGKGKLLEFRKLLRRDISGLGKGVYFLVDRDFDGMRGHPIDSDVYISDSYSFENHLVHREVLENILAVELHCHGDRQSRENVLGVFEEIYTAFLVATKPINERIFYARRLGINTTTIPNKLKKLADVTLTTVDALQEEIAAIVGLEREPAQEEIDSLHGEFEELDHRINYRGKFAFMFFLRWLDLLGKDRNSEQPILFKGAEKIAAVANGQISLDSIAAKSLPPPLFRQFVQTIPRPNGLKPVAARAAYG